jgi:hypothetical protein
VHRLVVIDYSSRQRRDAAAIRGTVADVIGHSATSDLLVRFRNWAFLKPQVASPVKPRLELRANRPFFFDANVGAGSLQYGAFHRVASSKETSDRTTGLLVMMSADLCCLFIAPGSK